MTGRILTTAGATAAVAHDAADELASRGWEVTVSDGTAAVAFLDRLRPDVVHVHGLAGLPVDLLDAAATRGIPVLLTAHDALEVVAAPGFAAQRDALAARVAARIGRCHAPSALAVGVLADAGLPAAMLDVVPQPDDEGAALAAYADALEAAYRGEALPAPAATEPIAVRWTGDHESATSLATINRAVCASLAGRPGLAVERCEIDGTSLDGPRERPPALEIRHRWPPDFAVPPVGRLALIQPWEFGAIPTAWEEPLRHSVDELWVPSEYVRRMYLEGGVPAERVHVVPNGVDLEAFRPDGPRRALDAGAGTRFLFVGGTISRKGPDVLVRAYAEAFEGRDDVTLVVKDVSPGRHYKGRNAGDRLREFAAETDLPRLVYLDDDLDTEELAALYRSCDVLVHPYRGEGFAMPVLEAMACGLPVVVTAGGPTDEFVPDAAGWRIAATRVFPPQSFVGGTPTSTPIWVLEPDVDHLVTILREVDADVTGRAARAAAAHAAAQAYGWDAIADRYAERIAELAARAPRSTTSPVTPLALPDARAVNVLATPAWAGQDRLGELLAAWAGAYAAGDDAALFLLADPDVDGDPASWEARVLDAADAAGVDLEALADIAILDHAGVEGLRAVHAAFDAYVPLHDGCAGHARLADAAGATILAPEAPALRAWAGRAARAA